MNKEDLLKIVGELGYPLFLTEKYNLNEVLAEVVISKDTRLWEGFPVLLRNKFDKEDFDLSASLAFLSVDERVLYWDLVFMSLALYEMFHLSSANNKFREIQEIPTEVEKWKKYFSEGQSINVGSVALFLDRVKRLFQDYYVLGKKESENKILKVQEEMTTQYLLSQVLSPKQKELVYKKLNGEPLSKTEKEYFSRAVKKKLLALANPELSKLASQILND